MEYFIGSLITMLVAWVTSRLYRASYQNTKLKLPMMTQAYKYSYLRLTYPFLQYQSKEAELKTQATDYHDKRSTRVVVMDGTAYWVSNNALYTGIMDESGEITKESIKTVDTMTMDKVELDKIVMIIDKLTEGSQDDSGNPGNKKI